MTRSLQLPYLLTAAASGLLFGAGLYVSQMVDPYKVLNFLNFAAIPSGGWDPSLAFVMGGGLLVMFVAVRYAGGRSAPLFADTFNEPEFKRIDTRLVGGAALFGVGWGMSGVCPGPALSLIAFAPDNLLILLLAIFAGSYLGSFIVPSGRERRLALAQ